MSKAQGTAKGTVSVIAQQLLEGASLDRKKGEIYEGIMGEINKLYPYRLEGTDGTTKMTRPDGFELTTFLASQFDCWPVDAEKVPVTFSNAYKKLVAMRKGETVDRPLTADQQNAVDAINRFSNWSSGWKMSIIRAYKDETVSKELSQKREELLKSIPAKERKNPEIVEKVEKAALKAVKEGHKTHQNPRLFDANGNFKATVVEKLAPEHQASLAVNLAKTHSDVLVDALKAAGKSVMAAGKLEDLKTSILLDMIDARARKGEFKNSGEAMKLVNELRKLYAEKSPVAVAPKAKKVANA